MSAPAYSLVAQQDLSEKDDLPQPTQGPDPNNSTPPSPSPDRVDAKVEEPLKPLSEKDIKQDEKSEVPIANNPEKEDYDDYSKFDDDDEEDEEPPKPPPKPSTAHPPLRLSRRAYDSILLFLIFIMLLWPFIFWIVIRAKGGSQMGNTAAKIIANHPHTTTFFVTLVANIITVITNILFSLAVIRLAQEWLGKKRRLNRRVTVFHVALLSGARHQSWPWTRPELKKLLAHNKWLPVGILWICITVFTFVPSSASSLLTPVIFNKTASLIGNEIDFSTTAQECQSWLTANDLTNNCDWQFFGDVPYTTCLGENQLVDVLESGRGNILSLLSNNTESLTLSQLGAKSGIRFLGPIGGVLPMGPDGVPAFDTTFPTSPFSNPNTAAGMLVYNYTLSHQGLATQLSCRYDNTTAVRVSAVPGDSTYVYQYNGNCSAVGQAEVLGPGVKTSVSVRSNNTLAYWACQSPPASTQGSPTYYIYLHAGATGSYSKVFGNMVCTVNQALPAVYDVTYQSGLGVFTLGPDVTVASTLPPQIMQRVLKGLTSIVWESQNWESNLVAESVITFAVKSFNIRQPYQSLDQYLRMTEAMLQGIIEYEATYIRLVYSTRTPKPPTQCLRTVNGSAIFAVWGWSSEVTQIALVMPMILITLSAFGILVLAIVTTTSDDEYNAGDLLASRPLLEAAIKQSAESQEKGEKPDPEDQVQWDVLDYGPQEATKEAFTSEDIAELDYWGVVQEWLGIGK